MKIGEHNFVQQLMRHNEKALDYVMNEYGGLVKAVICKQLGGRPDLQEECLNDVFWQVWENIEHFDMEKGNFKNWIAGVARYRSIDVLRKYRRRIQEGQMQEIEDLEGKNEIEKILERELSEETENLLQCLKPVDRKIFIDLYVEEKSVEEVAEDVQMTKQDIYNHVSKGRKKLRKTAGFRN